VIVKKINLVMDEIAEIKPLNIVEIEKTLKAKD